jgi:uncharacterized cupin superfamily protein
VKTIKARDLVHQPLKSSRSGESLSLSCVVSDLLGTNQLFAHHDILRPGNKSSSAHRHSNIDEVVFIIKGSATVNHGDENFIINQGDFICFDSNIPALHYLINHTEQDTETLTFSINDPSDRVIYI